MPLRTLEVSAPTDELEAMAEAPENSIIPFNDGNALYQDADYQAAMEAYQQAIETGDPPENSGVNGLKNVALGLGIYRSFETGRRLEYSGGLPVDLPEDYQNTRF